MKILVHVTVLQGIMSSLLRGSDRRAQVLKLRCEANANLKGVSHDNNRRELIPKKNRMSHHGGAAGSTRVEFVYMAKAVWQKNIGIGQHDGAGMGGGLDLWHQLLVHNGLLISRFY